MSMSENPTAPVVELELGGTTRQMRFDFRAIAAAEKVCGRNLLLARNWNTLNVGDVIAVVWATCQRTDPELTIEQVGEMIHLGNYNDALTAIGRAWVLATPEPTPGSSRGATSEDGDAPLESPPSSIGSSSGRRRGSPSA